jgi:hypothetical protein
VVGAFEVVVAHLALDYAGEGAQPPDRQALGQDLADRQPGRSTPAVLVVYGWMPLLVSREGG